MQTSKSNKFKANTVSTYKTKTEERMIYETQWS